MATTRYKLAEQVQNLLKNGNVKANTTVQIEDIIEAINQITNSLFKQDFLSVTMPSGDTIPNGIMISTYDNITPVAYKGVSKITLPATYINLPKGMGVYSICFSNETNNDFVPIPAGSQSMLKTEQLINNLLGTPAFEVNGNVAIFNQDLTATYAGRNVMVKLVTPDITAMDDYTNLPIPSDMEADIVQGAFKLFAAQLPASKIDDPSAEQKTDSK